MIKKLFLALFLGATLLSVYAQEKEKQNLTVEQIVKSMPTGITVPKSAVIEWHDESNFVIRESGNKISLCNVKSGKKTPHTLAKPKVQPSILTEMRKTVSNPTLSPNLTKVAYTKDNNLYVMDIASKKHTALTTDGSNLILNGWSSWVYYEEILGRSTNYKAFWWSPDSKKIAYYKFDDTNVPMFPIYDSKGHYGKLTETRYPKAGGEILK